MTSISAYAVPGYDPAKYISDPDNKLGCVLMDVSVEGFEYTNDALENQYYSDDPELWFVRGIPATPHLTVFYGFLPEVPQEEVELLLKFAMESYDGPECSFAEGEMPMMGFAGFSNFGRNDYDCWVAEVDPNSDVIQHIRGILGFAPHINTFHEYKPHVTLGYFNKGSVERADIWAPNWIAGTKFRLGGIYDES